MAAIALGYMAPMIAMWWIGPSVGWLADTRGAASGWDFRFLGGIVPYPYPFTGRAAIGLALIGVPPLLFIVLWLWSRSRSSIVGPSAR